MIFNSIDLANMQTEQSDHMMDSCKLYAVVETVDSFGQAVESWPTAGSEISCGLDMRPSSERRNAEYTVTQYDATLRLPISTTVTARYKVEITKRFGVSITALMYEVMSPVQRGPSGIRLVLKRIET